MSVLLVTRSDDNNAVALVAAALSRRGQTAIRIDTDHYPDLVRLTTRLASQQRGRTTQPLVERHLDTPAGRFDLEEVSAVWYRRFYAGGALPAELGDLRAPAVDEARRSLHGMLGALSCFQLDPVESIRRCDHKEMQLVRGRALGLDVPRTLFTNDPAEARAFFDACGGRMVTKMQSSFAVMRDGREHVVFTNVVAREHLADLDRLRFCPMTFQEHVDKALELRVTVVGNEVMAAAVDSQRLSRTRVDWRRDGVALLKAWRPYQLPRSVERSLRALLGEIGLNYGAADFIVTPDGRHVFLEVNAGGEWLWLDDSQRAGPGLPIAEAIAHTLTTPSARARFSRAGE